MGICITQLFENCEKLIAAGKIGEDGQNLKYHQISSEFIIVSLWFPST